MGSRVPAADSTNNRLDHEVIGNKADAAVQAKADTASIVAYCKATLDILAGSDGVTTFPAAAAPANGVSMAEVIRFISDTQLTAVEATGDADIDTSESDYTTFITILTITPAALSPLIDLVIDLDWNKASTGFDNVATAADTLDVCVQTKTDGTNWRTVESGTQITANGDGSLEAEESGQRFKVGMIGVDAEVRVLVKLSAERGDVEIPYRVTYRAAAAPTITAVAAA